MRDERPDFWLVEGDTFWPDLGVDRVACWIFDGPRRMIRDYDVKQVLVRVAPPVTDDGVQTDRVLVDWHRPDRRGLRHWVRANTGVYSLRPTAETRNGCFDIDDTIGGHKMTATTAPDSMNDG